ncbi:molybdopterin synthase sulfur carrier subunit [Rhodoligotrophos appendicifer]|uniref:molybdopterin converting factor subunit 1 n=1 Tax=Rhodoligotrophos appendicifer TaxID=987056 RepID=UPI0011867E64|nr:molybdopterin converting factor subunit 1 [Rhodoligotrophos appendicifer]
MKILYFAWVRERVGTAQEELNLPTEIKTVADVIDWLTKKDETYAYAFGDLRVVRAAVDQVLVPLDASIDGAREIAFFPPVTGG